MMEYMLKYQKRDYFKLYIYQKRDFIIDYLKKMIYY